MEPRVVIVFGVLADWIGGRVGELGLKGFFALSSSSGTLPFRRPANDFSFHVENFETSALGDAGIGLVTSDGDMICVGS